MISDFDHFETRLARTSDDLKGAQRLRYRVFVEELGGDGDMVDHDQKFEADKFDSHFDHLILVDKRVSPETFDHVAGVYRLVSGEVAEQTSGFYSESEYDLSVLKSSGRRLLELGRSCLHPNCRGGTAMFQMWKALGGYIHEHDIELMFGVASFHGTDVSKLRQPLAYLHHHHLATEEIRVISREPQDMNLVARDEIDRLAAMRATPALIKAYLRLGGTVGQGAFVDRAFNTTDVCLLLDTKAMSARQKAIYSSVPKTGT